MEYKLVVNYVKLNPIICSTIVGGISLFIVCRTRLNILSPFYIQNVVNSNATTIFNCVKIYSICELRVNNIINKTLNKIYTIFPTQKSLTIYCNGNNVSNNVGGTHDLVILSDNKNKQCVSHLLSRSPYILSNVRLLNVSIDFNNIKYDICLLDGNANYYIVDNRLNCAFIKYYLKNILKINIDVLNEQFKYNISIIDNDVNMCDFNETKELIFFENEYKIVDANN